MILRPEDPHAARLRRVRIHIVILAVAAVLLAGLDVIVDFFYAWAAVGGDTGIPPAASAVEREHVCFFLALASAGTGITATALTPILPETARGLIQGRVLRAMTAAALLLAVLAPTCLM